MLDSKDKKLDGQSLWSFELPKEIEVSDEYAPLSSEDEELVLKVHQRLIQEVDLKAIESMGPGRSREAVEIAARTLAGEVAPTLYGERREQMVKRIVDDAIALGPLEPIVNDDTVSEVMINAPDEIYFERDGIIYLSALRFRDETT